MNSIHYIKGKSVGQKAAEIAKKAPAALVLYPAGFVVGFVSAFMPDKKQQQEQQKEEQHPEITIPEVVTA